MTIEYKKDFDSNFAFYNLKSAISCFIEAYDKIFNYPDASHRKNSVQTEIDQIVYESLSDFYK